MDSKDRKPARPSLFETAPAPAGPQSRRRSIDAGLAGPAKANVRRRFWPWVLVVGLAAIGIAGWVAFSERAVSTRVEVAYVPGAGAGDAPAAEGSTAVLVEGGPIGDRETGGASGSVVEPNAGADNASDASRQGTGGTDLASRFGLDTAATSGTKRPSVGESRPAPATARAATPTDRADLLAVLMANIREQPQATGTDAAPQTMDALIAQLSKDSAVASAPDTPIRAGADTGDQSSANVQRQLRSCPAANTTAGIRCRQKLCAKYRGDPACPAG